MVFSQFKVVKETIKYSIYVDKVFLKTVSSEIEAINICEDLKEVSPDKELVYLIYHWTKNELTSNKKVIDTIQVIRVKDLKGWIDHTGENTIAYLPFYNNGIIDFKTDSVYNWQSKYNFKRTKTFGKISYENLDIPFQFADLWSDGNTVHWVITQKSVRTSSWINGESFKEYIPDSSTKVANGWEIYFGVPATGELTIENENEKGEVIRITTTLKL